MICQVNGIQRKGGEAIVLFDKVGYKIKKVTRDEDRYLIIIERTIHQEDITYIETYAPDL